jgi:hypothetical protein
MTIRDGDLPESGGGDVSSLTESRGQGPGRPGGDLEEISLVTPGRVDLAKILGSRLGEGMLLFVDLDRTRVNIALASLRVGQLAPAVLA